MGIFDKFKLGLSKSSKNLSSGLNDFIRNCMLYKSNDSKTYDLSENSINWLKSKCQFDIQNIIAIIALFIR